MVGGPSPKQARFEERKTGKHQHSNAVEFVIQPRRELARRGHFFAQTLLDESPIPFYRVRTFATQLESATLIHHRAPGPGLYKPADAPMLQPAMTDWEVHDDDIRRVLFFR